MKKKLFLAGYFLLISSTFSLFFVSCRKNSSHKPATSNTISLTLESLKPENVTLYSENLPENVKLIFRAAAEWQKLEVSQIAIKDDTLVLLNSSDITIPVKKVMDHHAFSVNNVDQRMNLHPIYQTGTVNCPVTIPQNPNKRVRISVFTGQLPTDWHNATVAAINQWNALSNKLEFYINNVVIKGNNTSHIRITMYIDPDPNSTTVAYAEVSTGGPPGNYVRINTQYNNLPADLKMYAIVHELGHTIGYRHTDQTDGSLIPGTPNVDGASVMNSFIAASWSGFSSWDAFAHTSMYPNVAPNAPTCTY
jgi:hypothetical protein